MSQQAGKQMPDSNLTLLSSDPEVSLKACQAFRLSRLGREVEGVLCATLLMLDMPGRNL